jgi:hypothetical protein
MSRSPGFIEPLPSEDARGWRRTSSSEAALTLTTKTAPWLLPATPSIDNDARLARSGLTLGSGPELNGQSASGSCWRRSVIRRQPQTLPDPACGRR